LTNPTPAVLVIGYKRVENIKKILDICKLAGISTIYVSIDGPRENDKDGIGIQNLIARAVGDFECGFEGQVFSYFRKLNRGCSASVISSCDWVFEREQQVFIFEDDCIPSLDFFSFGINFFPELAKSKKALLISGTQFAPREIAGNSAVFSRYPLIWGWATTKSKWNIMKNSFGKESVSCLVNLSAAEKRYWLAGARRALEGRVDVWDTALARFMVFQDYKAILPPVSLVENIGNDEHATHTKTASRFLNISSVELSRISDSVSSEPGVENWLKNNLYKISTRHLLTTRITQFIDQFSKPKLSDLPSRFFLAKNDF
jgi:hypothetical protein